MKLYIILLLSVFLISGCVTQPQVKDDSNISIFYHTSNFFLVTKENTISIQNNGTIIMTSFEQLNYQENGTWENRTKTITREELLDLAKFIADKGFFTRTLIDNRCEDCGTSKLTVSIDGTTRSIEGGKSFEDRKVLDDIIFRIKEISK